MTIVTTRTGATAAGAIPRGNRGQTTLDFAVGIGLFVLVLGFVFGFVPGLFAPLADDPARPQVADRAAGRLVTTLDRPGEPAVLNASCTRTLFGVEDLSDCGFDPDGPLTGVAGVGDDYGLNVSLARNRTAAPGLEPVVTDGGAELVAGPPVPGGSSSVDVARRVASLDGRDVTVVVRVW